MVGVQKSNNYKDPLYECLWDNLSVLVACWGPIIYHKWRYWCVLLNQQLQFIKPYEKCQFGIWKAIIY